MIGNSLNGMPLPREKTFFISGELGGRCLGSINGSALSSNASPDGERGISIPCSLNARLTVPTVTVVSPIKHKGIYESLSRRHRRSIR